jgi:signal transduction histidine kinase
VTLNSSIRDGLWRVYLDDQGPGVPLEYRDRILERFFRLPLASAAAEEGSGSGLAICRSIMSLHDGTIWAEASCDYAGLRIVLEMPAETLHEPADLLPAARSRQAAEV